MWNVEWSKSKAVTIGTVLCILLLLMFGCSGSGNNGQTGKPGQTGHAVQAGKNKQSTPQPVPSNPLFKTYREVLTYPGTDYNEIIKKNDAIQTQARDYLQQNPQGEKRNEVERILTEMKDMQKDLQREQFEFLELNKSFKPNPTPYEADIELTDIQSFISRYPRTFKKDELAAKSDGLNFNKFQAEITGPLKTIADVNRVVQTANSYLSKIQDKALKTKIADKINATEAVRQSIYETEFRLKAAELMKQCRRQAMDIAGKSHTYSKIESVNEAVVNGDMSKPSTHAPFVFEYVIIMRGALVGFNRYRLVLKGGGTVSGTLQSGASYVVTGVTKLLDQRVN